jgi:quercetin dioxygenase-like cupin family protein
MTSARSPARDASSRRGQATERETLASWTGARVIRWSFDVGEGLPPHRAPSPALVLCLRGRIRFVLKGEPRLLEEGDSVVMAEGDEHALLTGEPSGMLLVLGGSEAPPVGDVGPS